VRAPGFLLLLLPLGSSVSVASSSTAPPTGALIHVPALGLDLPLLLEVPDAGRLAGLSRYASYRATQDGTMPTLRLGERRLRVPTVRWLDQLGVTYEAVQP
jgi:hypothetical protein